MEQQTDNRNNHEIIDLLVIAICTLLCGGVTFNSMEDFGYAKLAWFKTSLQMRQGIPSHDTFNRLFAALDPAKFLDCFLRWRQSLRRAIRGEVAAIDGKALRRAARNIWQMKSSKPTPNMSWLSNASGKPCMEKSKSYGPSRKLRDPRVKQLNASWDHSCLLSLLAV